MITLLQSIVCLPNRSKRYYFIMEIFPKEMVKQILLHIHNTEDWFPIFLVCKEWNQIALQLFDPSVDSNSAICRACTNNLPLSVKRLLKDDRVDPTAYF